SSDLTETLQRFHVALAFLASVACAAFEFVEHGTPCAVAFRGRGVVAQPRPLCEPLQVRQMMVEQPQQYEDEHADAEPRAEGETHDERDQGAYQNEDQRSGPDLVHGRANSEGRNIRVRCAGTDPDATRPR